jgi:hypothetical protein
MRDQRLLRRRRQVAIHVHVVQFGGVCKFMKAGALARLARCLRSVEPVAGHHSIVAVRLLTVNQLLLLFGRLSAFNQIIHFCLIKQYLV